MSATTFSGLELRSIGPAINSGRVIDFAVDPHAERVERLGSGRRPHDPVVLAVAAPEVSGDRGQYLRIVVDCSA